MDFEMLSPFGVEIHHDLAMPFNKAEQSAIVELFAIYGLILVRGQNLSIERQRAICSLIGPILKREGEGNALSNEVGGPSVSALAWHADAAYTEAPFDALSLHAIDVVDGASSTRFISAEQAWQKLSPELASAMQAHEQAMVSPHYTRLAEPTYLGPDSDALVKSHRPCVLINPHNGRKVLWASELQTARILGMSSEESSATLEAVFSQAYDAANVLEHRWRNGDFIVWDNIAIQHARGELAGVGRRILQRVIVGREGVAPHIAAGSLKAVVSTDLPSTH